MLFTCEGPKLALARSLGPRPGLVSSKKSMGFQGWCFRKPPVSNSSRFLWVPSRSMSTERSSLWGAGSGAETQKKAETMKGPRGQPGWRNREP